MDFANILKAFPSTIGEELLKELDAVSIPADASRDEVLQYLTEATNRVKLSPAYTSITDPEKVALVEMLMKFVPHAGATALFV